MSARISFDDGRHWYDADDIEDNLHSTQTAVLRCWKDILGAMLPSGRTEAAMLTPTDCTETEFLLAYLDNTHTDLVVNQYRDCPLLTGEAMSAEEAEKLWAVMESLPQ